MNKKQVIITGTSRGIGYELVKCFAEAGHKVLALSRNCDPIDELKLDGVETISCNIWSQNDINKVHNFLIRSWNRVDILINNAGALINKPLEDTSMEDFIDVYKTNVFGVAETIKTVVPFMDHNGHVVTISSMGGVQGSVKFPGLAAYSSSKGAVVTLMEVLAEEYKERGPNFNTLALGAVQTEMLEEAFPDYKAPVSAKEMADYIYNFSLTAHKYYNGKLLQVSRTTP